MITEQNIDQYYNEECYSNYYRKSEYDEDVVAEIADRMYEDSLFEEGD